MIPLKLLWDYNHTNHEGLFCQHLGKTVKLTLSLCYAAVVNMHHCHSHISFSLIEMTCTPSKLWLLWLGFDSVLVFPSKLVWELNDFILDFSRL